MSRRSRIVGFGSAALLVVAGIGCAFAFSGGLAQNLAFVLVGLGMVLATSLVFYEVGLTEDRARAREEEEKRRKSQAPEERRKPPARSARRPLDRMRGRSRRLR
jgi:hypothetical protein